MFLSRFLKIITIGFILFLGTSLSRITIGQCIYNVDPASFSIPGVGGFAYINIDAGSCENYNVSSYDTWYYYYVDYYEHTITVYAESNNDSYRTGTIVVHDNWTNQDYYINFSQDIGCEPLPAVSEIKGGKSDVCYNETVTFYIDPVDGATLYNWAVNGNSVGQYGTSATVTFSAYSAPFYLSVSAYNDCGYGNHGPQTTRQINLISPPTITSHPSSLQVCNGNNAVFSVSAQNASGYQWEQNANGTWQTIPGASGSTLNTGTTTASMNGWQYRCQVRNSCSNIYTNPATLSINYVGAAGNMTGPNSVCAGQIASYSVDPIYGSNSFQWSVPTGVTIFSGLGTNSINVSFSEDAVSGNISVQGTNSCGSGIPSVIYVAVHPNPTPPITTNSPVCWAGALNLATNSYASYSWFGPNGFSSYQQNPVISNVSDFMEGYYHLSVTDVYGCSGSSSTEVRVNDLFSANITGGSSPICYNGLPGTFTANATGGTGTYTYQWFKDGIQTSTQQTYTPGPLTTNSTIYCSIASGNCGTIISNSISIIVYQNLTAVLQGGSSPICYNSSPGTLSVNPAGGNNTFTYQWFKNDSPTGVTTSTYNPGSLQATSDIYCLVSSGSCTPVRSNVFRVVVRDPVIAGTISNSNAQTICSNTDPSLLNNNSSAYGGSGSFSYQWESSPNGYSAWNNILGATSSYYDPAALSVTTFFRRRATDNAGCGTVFTDPTTIGIYPQLYAGSISGDNTSCYGYVPGNVNSVSPATGGSGSLTYTWMVTSDNGESWAQTGGNNLNLDLSLTFLTTNSIFHRLVTDNVCSTTISSNNVTKTVLDQISAGVISGDETLCLNVDATEIVGTQPKGGTNSFTYTWESSEDNGSTWTLVENAISENYDPPALQSTMQYKRRVNDASCGVEYSNPVTKTVKDIKPGIIAGDQTIDYGTNTSTIINDQSSSDYLGTSTYHWEVSSNQTNWDIITNTNVLEYNPGNLISTKYFRRAVSDQCRTVYSNVVTKNWVFHNVTYIEQPNAERNIITSNQVGTTQGQTTITPLGSAVYTIPIFCSPGTNNVQPSMSIQYNSQSGNDLLGWGWSIGGVSAISRIPKQYYINNEIKGIAMNSGDELALDGSRIVFDQGSLKYRTEVESFSEITPHGTSGLGPDWFDVKVIKDGSSFEYGNAQNSFLKNDQGTKLNWYLTKYKDIHGNYIKYNYDVDQISGQIFLSSIQYTGNDSTNSNPYNEIFFQYGKRSDPFNYYSGGIKIRNGLLLTKIICKTEGQIVRTYELGYKDVSLNSLYSTLISVTETGLNGTRFNSTIFGYDDQQQSPENTSSLSIVGKNTLSLIDFNGDGKSDIATIPEKDTYSVSDSIRIYINNGNNFQILQSIPINSYTIHLEKPLYYGKFYGGNTVDFNGDGKGDFFTTEIVNNISHDPEFGNQYKLCKKYYFNQNENKLIPFNSKPLDPNSVMLPGDFDGNGYTDFLIYPLESNTFELDLTTGWYDDNVTRGTNEISKYGNIGIPFSNRVFTGDFNGDGKIDLCIIENNNYLHIYTFNSETNVFDEIVNPFIFPYSNFSFGDINGDGKNDIGCIENNLLTVFFSNGLGFQKVTFGQKHGSSLSIADINGDGKGEICESYIEKELIDNGETTYWQLYPKQFINYLNGDNLSLQEFDVNFSEAEVYDSNIYFADINGDGRAEQIYNPNVTNLNTVRIWNYRPNDKSRLLSVILNGLNIKTKITYGVLPQSSNYSTSSSNFSLPVLRYPLPINLVEKIESYGPGKVLPYVNTSYSYEDILLHIQGKGLLGFSKTITEDLITLTKTETTFTRGTFYNVYPLNTKQYVNNQLILESINNGSEKPLGNGSYVQFFPTVYTIDHLKGSKTEKITTLFDTGLYPSKYFTHEERNNTYQKVNSDWQIVNQVTETFDNYNSFGNPRNISTTSIRGSESLTRNTAYQFNEKGLNENETNTFGSSPDVIKTFTYTEYGNIFSSSISCNSKIRGESYTYDPHFRFMTSKTNDLNQTISFVNDPVSGNILEEHDYTNLITSRSYDGFGREKGITYPYDLTPNNNTITYSMNWSPNLLGIGELYSTTTEADNQPTKITYYDFLGNELLSKTQTFDGSFIVSKKTYDSKGRPEKVYSPYNESSTADQYVKYAYDDLGRIHSETSYPANSVTSYTYDKLKTTVTKGSRSVTKEFDASGLLYQTSQAGGGTITYTYNAEGKPKTIISPSGTTSIDYDEYGYQDKLHDIDAGTIDYDYNGFGDLITQTDAKGNITNSKYDLIGRITQKNWTNGETIKYRYYPGNGLLRNMHIGGENAGTFRSQSFLYDEYNRVITRTDTILDRVFTENTSYDDFGNIDMKVINNDVTIKYFYNTHGFLYQMKANNQIIWETNSMNRFNVVNDFNLGNGINTTISYDPNGFEDVSESKLGSTIIQHWDYDFDAATGNMTKRSCLNPQGDLLEESFIYDDLDRLLNYVVNDTTYKTTYDLGGKGNIETKSYVGKYWYNSNKVHKIDSINSLPQSIPTISNHEIEYTKYNKISSIQSGESPIKKLELIYGPDEQRVKTVYKVNNETTKTKFFALGSYELEIVGETERGLYYISTPTGLTTIIEKTNEQINYYYIQTDILGSFDVITNSQGSIVEKLNFDPWGRRRNPNDWSYNNVPENFFFDRGFTGHEHLDQFGLINMNGRVYDPLIGIFLSPDKYVQNPASIQNFNRYSYAFNNPLTNTDPDGNFVITALVTLANMYFNGVMANDFQFNPAKWDWKSISTYTSMARGGFSGWQMGTQLEEKIQSNRFWKGYDRTIKMDEISLQETGGTQLPDNYDLYGFQKKYFPNYTYRNKVTMLYDNEIIKSSAEPGKLPPLAFTKQELVNDKYQIFFGEGAFRSQGYLYLSMGHEFIHVGHFVKFGLNFDKDMSEYAAYMWNAAYLHSSDNKGWSIFKKAALSYGKYDLSKNSSFLKIEPYLITKQNNYGLPFFTYLKLFN